MPVARIISDPSADTSALRLRLEREGYSVEFAASRDAGAGADLLIEVESVDAARALDYAATLASASDAVVVVASGVVAAPIEEQRFAPAVAAEPVRAEDELPAANEPVATNHADADPHEPTIDLRTGAGAVLGLLGNTASDFKSAISESGDGVRESLSEVKTRVGSVLDDLKRKRELAAEARRLERERAELEKEERRREQELLQQQRMQAEMRAREERERLRREHEAQRHAAMEAERARLAAEADRIRQERERIAAERAAAIPAPPIVSATPPPQRIQPAEVAPGVWRGAPILQPRAQAPRSLRTSAAQRSPRRSAVPRMSPRDQKMQRAAFIASVVTLVAMLGFAAFINLHPSSPISHSMVQNPVEEKTPFGPAQINQAQNVAKPSPPPPQHAAAARTTLPQAEAPALSQHPATKPVRRHHRSADDVTAEDEVVVHHYGAPAKRPPSTQQRAGVRRYSDSE